ncbi:hemagglutinin repeat-containing protein, partial [Xenorhabdus bovienii]|uniref:hemagglutinin repeat-containing protein n=1 Tax=Xenorhabdus bovienii TaxID=40576 RepID=UPI0023B32049
NQVMATDIDGNNVRLSGANLKLDGQQLHQLDRTNNNQWKISWKYSVINENEKYQQEGNTINASGNVHLTANEGNAEVLGSQIKAKNQLTV